MIIGQRQVTGPPGKEEGMGKYCQAFSAQPDPDTLRGAAQSIVLCGCVLALVHRGNSCSVNTFTIIDICFGLVFVWTYIVLGKERQESRK